ncbi:MAG: FmdE family protein [Actinomycetota bacterium]|nr:FmdE family protein [Actinomycetota bacterium]
MGYRDDINNLIFNNDLEGLLNKSSEFHGHICSFSAYGVKAGCYAMRKLAVSDEGMEQVIAITETNNCFSDGIQLVTGCTFGNNGLIFHDIGKTAVTVINRKSSESVRLSLNSDYWDSRKDVYPELFDYFDRIVKRREKVSASEKNKYFKISEEMAINELKMPENEIFTIKRDKTEPPAYAPIFDSMICSVCKESIMESRTGIKNGSPICISCNSAPYFFMDGNGISFQK